MERILIALHPVYDGIIIYRPGMRIANDLEFTWDSCTIVVTFISETIVSPNAAFWLEAILIREIEWQLRTQPIWRLR